jgi:hypothetical protein
MPYASKQLAKNEAIMRAGEQLPVELVTWEKKRSLGEVRLLRMSDQERRSRALKFFFSCSGLSLLAIVFPPHFLWPIIGFGVGVGGFFVAGGAIIAPRSGACEWAYFSLRNRESAASVPSSLASSPACQDARERPSTARRAVR